MSDLSAIIRRIPVDAAKLVLGFGAVVVVLLWVAIAWDLGKDRDRVLADAQAKTGNMARALDEHIRRTVAGLDQTLLYLKAEYERGPAQFSLNASIGNNVILRQVSVQIARIDADGMLADSNVPNFARVDLSDREHFRVHKTGIGDRLFVSRPVLGRASGKWSIQLTRRLDGPKGEFAGVLVVSLDPHYLSDFYDSIDVGAKGSVVLVGRDGVVRAANTLDGTHWGESIDTALVERLFVTSAGNAVVKGPLDNESRVTSFRALDSMSLALVVGLSEDEMLAAQRKTELAYVLGGLVLTAVLGGAALLLFALVRNQERIASDLTANRVELVEHRERLKRYVADLERIAEVSAHDLQEPLRRVVAYAQLLSKHAETVLDEEGRGYVRQVIEGARRIRKLVQDLEAFVAVDHFPPVEDVTPAEGALAIATRRLAQDIEQASATLMAGPLPNVAAEEKSLAEVFTQLVDNSLRYRSPVRKLLVHVGARREGAMVVFTVRDNGIGIERRHWGRIFEIFHRLHGVDDHPGTGMGLAIVRRIVERLGGKVWVESVLGEGTAFNFTLPLEPTMPSAKATLDQEVQAA